MNKVTFYFIVLITTVTLFSCQKDDPVAEITPPRVYADQYKTDIADIEEYLNNYYFSDPVNNPGKTNDQDVTITKIPVGGTQRSIMSYLNAATFPKLLIRKVKLHDVDYELYYLVLREGVGESPCNVDGVFAAYRGDYLSRDITTKVLAATKFEESKFPQVLPLYNTISGWGETFPQFKKGTFNTNADGSVSYNNFGAGVMFLPSGLSYYNRGAGSIPSYAPLVFSFKLYDIQRSDYENNGVTLAPDGIPSYQEDLNGDGYIYDYRNTINYPTPPAEEKIRYADDTDRDGIPDFIDSDDDGDNYTTKLEVTKTGGSNLLLDGPSLFYPYNPIISAPPQATDEKRGIPSYNKVTKLFDYTSPDRLRVHIDKDYPLKP